MRRGIVLRGWVGTALLAWMAALPLAGQPAVDAGSWWEIPYPSTFDAGELEMTLSPLRVEGNRFVDGGGNPVVLRGVSISDPDKIERDGKWSRAHFEAVKGWGADVVRVPVHPVAWRGRGKAGYFELLDDAVRWATELEMYLMIDWHTIGNVLTGLYQHPMYDTSRQETLEFWRSVAHRYRGVPTVAFYEIFNEPTTFNGTLGTASWEDWKAFNEEVIGVIFAHDRQVIPLVAGFDWAYDLTPVGEAPIEAEGIGYVSHPYPMKVVPPYEPKWERDFGFVAERYPLVITEFGFAGAGEPGAHVPVIAGDDYGPAILDYLGAKGASWVAWCFDPEWGPHLISDWDYTPTPAGRLFRDAMLGGRETVGAVERLDPALDRLVPPGAEIEVLAEGFDWSEGPLWIADGGYLLFSDVPRNQVLKWQQEVGVEVWLEPSGYTGTAPRGGEPGANGLVLDSAGRLVLSQHGDRRMARMEASLAAPRPVFTTLADRFDGRRFSSPNDAVYDSRGALYFTDPPYGLPEGPEDASRETPFHGVYRLDPDGSVSLVTGELSRPNGIALSPDERTLYVANSDPERAVWMAYDLEPDGAVAEGRVLFDATAWVGERPGLPDGLEVDVDGNLFATGPGGVLVLTPEGRHLGTILTGRPTANCAFGDDGRSLYITADSHLLRIRLATRGPVVGGEAAVASGR